MGSSCAVAIELGGRSNWGFGGGRGCSPITLAQWEVGYAIKSSAAAALTRQGPPPERSVLTRAYDHVAVLVHAHGCDGRSVAI